MAILTTDLIDGVRSRANIERTRHVTDAEILTWLNDEGSEFYNKLIAARENYITRRTTLTLGVPSFSVVPTAEHAFNPSVTVNSLTGAVTIPTGPLLAAPSYYEILALIVTPASENTTGETSFVVTVDGTDTDCMVTIAAGSDDKGSDSKHNPRFENGQTLEVTVFANAGADWDADVTLILQPFLAETIGNAAPLPDDFLKPVALSLSLSDDVTQPIMPLDSLNERSICQEWKHWISDQRLFVYPERNVKTGPYNLEYVPRWTELQLNPFPNALMREMEQFSEIIELGAAAMAKLKRKMIDDARELQSKQDRMVQSAIAAIPGRRGGPKHIPMPVKDKMQWHNGSAINRYWRY